MSGHTPGPWTVTRVSKSTILKDLYVSASPERIARVVVPSTSKDIGEYEANARLIAAAPDLLEALKDLREAIKSRGVISTVKALTKTDAAIAKTRS